METHNQTTPEVSRLLLSILNRFRLRGYISILLSRAEVKGQRPGLTKVSSPASDLPFHPEGREMGLRFTQASLSCFLKKKAAAGGQDIYSDKVTVKKGFKITTSVSMLNNSAFTVESLPILRGILRHKCFQVVWKKALKPKVEDRNDLNMPTQQNRSCQRLKVTHVSVSREK